MEQKQHAFSPSAFEANPPKNLHLKGGEGNIRSRLPWERRNTLAGRSSLPWPIQLCCQCITIAVLAARDQHLAVFQKSRGLIEAGSIHTGCETPRSRLWIVQLCRRLSDTISIDASSDQHLTVMEPCCGKIFMDDVHTARKAPGACPRVVQFGCCQGSGVTGEAASNQHLAVE